MVLGGFIYYVITDHALMPCVCDWVRHSELCFLFPPGGFIMMSTFGQMCYCQT